MTLTKEQIEKWLDCFMSAHPLSRFAFDPTTARAICDMALRSLGAESATMPKLMPHIRKRLERECEDAENPKGMSVHDGMTRVHSADIRYLLKLIDTLAAAPAESAEPVAPGEGTPPPRYVGGFCQDRERCVKRNAELAALKAAPPEDRDTTSFVDAYEGAMQQLAKALEEAIDPENPVGDWSPEIISKYATRLRAAETALTEIRKASQTMPLRGPVLDALKQYDAARASV